MKALKYDMHRPKHSGGDWQLLSEEDWNAWQKIANETDGVVTPANVLDVWSVVAEAKVQKDLVDGHKMMIDASSADLNSADPDELRQMFLDGGSKKVAALMLDGALAFVDKADGVIASKTGTSNRLGEKVDAAGDFAVTIMKLCSRWKIGEISSAEVMMLGGPKLLNIIASGVETARGIETHTSLADKGNEALRALTIVSYDVRELIKTKYQADAVNDGALPHEAMQPEIYERDLYLKADKIRSGLLATSFATGTLAGTVNLAKSFRFKHNSA